MNVTTLNMTTLDGGVVIKKGEGGGVRINNQDKVVDITENGTTEVVADDGYSGLGKVSVNVNVKGGGTSGASAGAVTYYDYDGTVLHSYSTDAFAALAEHPTLPERDGLVCQGWNYDLTKAKAYVAKYGMLNIGATYITDDGKTRLYIRIAARGRMAVPLYFSQTVANGVTIDWGDGSDTQTLSGTGNKSTTHKYASIGDYCITLSVAEGCTLGLGHNSSSYCVMGSTNANNSIYCNMLQAVEIGRNVTSIGNYAFKNCYSLTSVVIPDSVTSISAYTFYNCFFLASVVIPNGVTVINSYAFYQCFSLSSIVIPDSVTSIGEYTFYDCYSLASVVIPEGVIRIYSYVFRHCPILSSVVIPDSVTSISSNMFYQCFSLASVVIPKGVTSISSNMFQYCQGLTSVVIHDNVTSIQNYAFQNCLSLSSVIFPESITSINDSAFDYCYGMAFYDFSALTAVPSLSSVNAFNNIPSDCKIIVPDALYDEWIAATNWSTYASKIIKKSEWDALNV